jgi:hypothetical protein
MGRGPLHLCTGETMFPPWTPFVTAVPTPRFVSLPAG